MTVRIKGSVLFYQNVLFYQSLKEQGKKIETYIEGGIFKVIGSADGNYNKIKIFTRQS